MAANSGDVNAGDAATAVQYNDLREDVLDPITGHKHDGTAEGGTALGSPLTPKPSDFVGDGSDGDVTISGPTTLNRPFQYNSLTVNDAITPAAGSKGLLIFVKGTLTINASGSIRADGVGAVGGAGGNPGVNGQDGFISELDGLGDPSGGQVDGADGRKPFAMLAAITDAGDDIFIAFGAGGGGGAEGSAGDAGKGGGKWAGGGAGGNASGDDSGGGLGGNGGGFVIIFADTIIINASGAISADGSDGADAGVGGLGGGGGGGGGLVYLAKRTFTNNGTITVAGGLGGDIAPDDGGDGATGQVVEKTIPS